ncbi:hypothetical protein THOM_0823 [Trachipleistophora hominis]|uniref:Uncharacterized protein n=1 Tax=Trachipleistophora hominis TaxID=72359 RepID=L7JZQ4_TRAHO|nr:hypothetical protein THOM_0823 [Trachipleistophora hominis]
MKRTRSKEKTITKKITVKTSDHSEEESDENTQLESMNETRDQIMNKHRDYWTNVIENEITEFNIYKNYCVNDTINRKNVKLSDAVEDDLKIIQELGKTS